MKNLFFAAMFLLLLSCDDKASQSNEMPVYSSFRNIPNITGEEILAIEALQKNRASFVYGMTLSAEAFLKESGDVGGYAALVCSWLTELFGIPFMPAIYEWDNLIEGLESHKIDFSGDIAPTEERRKTWFMTDDIAKRAVASYDTMFKAVAMSTANTELEPIISVVTKALRSGVMQHLNVLYSQGHAEYKKNALFMLLNEDERAYLQNAPTVPLAARYFNYPVDFYNSYEGKWEGITFDVLHEVEELTGLTFKVVNDTNTELSELFNMVYDGRAHLMPELLYSEKRAEHVIWTKHIFLKDQLALLSTSTYPNVSVNEIPYKRIGVIKGTVRAETFRKWFPNAASITEYISDKNAMYALEHGEIDLVMASKNRLLSFLNFYDLSLFKANFMFDYPYESTFGFHKDQTILCSIMDKALPLVGIHMITEQWLTKTYDYRVKLMEAQRPWLIGATMLSSVILALILVMLYRSRNEEKQLESLVLKRTAELNEQRKLFEYMSLTDPLTGLPNRRNLDMRLDIEWRIALREKQQISFLMVDIDHFKNYNDQYGHQQGDEVLRTIAKTIKRTPKRPGDFVARWGGEEFAVLLSNTNSAGALKIAEAIRANVEKMNVPLSNGIVVKLTVSVGVNSLVPEQNNSLETFVSAADKELYKAKEAGRNRVCVS
jgi:diguanylate cyclase (GGDEF)-like protein